MPEIEIRPAQLADIAPLMQMSWNYQSLYVWQMDRILEKGLISVHFRETRLPRPVKVEYPTPLERLTQALGQMNGVLVAALDGQAVGALIAKENQGASTAWVTDMVVDSELRRKGVGTALVLAAQRWAAKRNLRRMVLEMQSKNYPAIQLASKLGYEFSGYNDHYYENRDIALFFSSYIR
jgi:ribosomal protein S18 acetylase RimI-like enzyme